MNLATWTAIADDYGKSFGRTIEATDAVEYPAAIMSLLSDVQEHNGGGNLTPEANSMLNAAKLMLSRMIDAGRQAERSVDKCGFTIGGLVCDRTRHGDIGHFTSNGVRFGDLT